MRRRVINFIGIGMLALGSLAACGSDESADAPAAESASANDGGESAPADTMAPESADTIAPDSGEVVPDSLPDMTGMLTDECLEIYERLTSAFGSVVSGTDSDPAGSFASLGEAFGNLRAIVPDDLRDDVDLMEEAYANMEKAFAEYDYDVTKMMADPDALNLLNEINSEEFATASNNLSAWIDTECVMG